MFKHRIIDLSFYYFFHFLTIWPLSVPFAFFPSVAALDLHIFFAFVTPMRHTERYLFDIPSCVYPQETSSIMDS